MISRNISDPSFIIMDKIYGQIEFNSFISRFINVPEFKRLQNIKQTGPVSYNSISNIHTRYEHCLGVSYLARQILLILYQNSNFFIDEKIVNLISLAGLYHDIGHTLGSHCFDMFIGHYIPRDKIKSHEEIGCIILRYINRKYEMGLSEDDLSLVCDLINPMKELKFPDMKYLYQIISNNEDGIDADRLDYLKRDNNSYYEISYKRLFNHSKIIDNTICFHPDTVYDISRFHQLRFLAYFNIYFGKKIMGLDIMYEELIEMIVKKNGNEMLEIFRDNFDVEIYCKYTDDMINSILIQNEVNIAKRLNNRNPYKTIYHEYIDTKEFYIQFIKYFIRKTQLFNSHEILDFFTNNCLLLGNYLDFLLFHQHNDVYSKDFVLINNNNNNNITNYCSNFLKSIDSIDTLRHHFIRTFESELSHTIKEKDNYSIVTRRLLATECGKDPFNFVNFHNGDSIMKIERPIDLYRPTSFDFSLIMVVSKAEVHILEEFKFVKCLLNDILYTN